MKTVSVLNISVLMDMLENSAIVSPSPHSVSDSLINACSYTDINECETNNTCDEHADCHDTDGSYWCKCRAGFLGDGHYCIGRSHLHIFLYNRHILHAVNTLQCIID